VRSDTKTTQTGKKTEGLFTAIPERRSSPAVRNGYAERRESFIVFRNEGEYITAPQLFNSPWIAAPFTAQLAGIGKA
jgi:hypothetical protein